MSGPPSLEWYHIPHIRIAHSFCEADLLIVGSISVDCLCESVWEFQLDRHTYHAVSYAVHHVDCGYGQ